MVGKKADYSVFELVGLTAGMLAVCLVRMMVVCLVAVTAG